MLSLNTFSLIASDGAHHTATFGPVHEPLSTILRSCRPPASLSICYAQQEHILSKFSTVLTVMPSMQAHPVYRLSINGSQPLLLIYNVPAEALALLKSFIGGHGFEVGLFADLAIKCPLTCTYWVETSIRGESKGTQRAIPHTAMAKKKLGRPRKSDIDSTEGTKELVISPSTPIPQQMPVSIEQRRVCIECGCHQTPLWRRGPRGAGTLCNACGVKWNKQRHIRKQSLTDESALDIRTIERSIDANAPVASPKEIAQRSACSSEALNGKTLAPLKKRKVVLQAVALPQAQQ